MAKFKIYQMGLSTDDIRLLNRLGRSAAGIESPKIDAYNSVMWFGGSEKVPSRNVQIL